MPPSEDEDQGSQTVPLELNRPLSFIALTFLTFGLYPLVRFWKAGRAYALLVRDPGQRFSRLGALVIVELVFSHFFVPDQLQWAQWLSALLRFILGHLTIEEALRLRAQAAATHEISFNAAPRAFQLFLSGAAFWAPAAALVHPDGLLRPDWLEIVQAITLVLAAFSIACFFRDHNRFSHALLAMQASEAHPDPAL